MFFYGAADQFSSRPSNPSDSIFLNVPNGGIIFADGDAWREQKHFAHQTLRTFGMGQNLMEGKIHCSIASLVDHLNRSGLDTTSFLCRPH
jgi:hypothetical protein